MAGNIEYLHIHGKSDGNHAIATAVPYPEVPGYPNAPDLYAYMSYSDVVRSGNTLSISLSGGLYRSSLDGSATRYPHHIMVYAKLSTNGLEDSTGATKIIDKVAAASTWNDNACAFSGVNITATATSTSATNVWLQYYVLADCPSCTDTIHLIYQVQLTSPPAPTPKTVTFIDFDKTAHVISNVTRLPSTPYSGADGRIRYANLLWDGTAVWNPNASGAPTSAIHFTFKEWRLPPGYSWGDTLDKSIVLQSVWINSHSGVQDVGYNMENNYDGNTYTAKFYGYTSSSSSVIYTVTTKEKYMAGLSYTFSGEFVTNGDSTKYPKLGYAPEARYEFPLGFGSVGQSVYYPVRSSAGNTTSVWKYSRITYTNGHDEYHLNQTYGDATFPNGSIHNGVYTDTNGYKQNVKYDIRVIAEVTESGNAATRHFTDFYDTGSKKKLHKISNVTAWHTPIKFTIPTDKAKKTYTLELKSLWHNPQIWRYRIGSGRYSSAENCSQGNNWYQDAEVRKYVNGSWRVTNKWKYNNTTGEWENCDKDLLINNS